MPPRSRRAAPPPLYAGGAGRRAPGPLTALWPGLALCALLTAVAYGVARVPGPSVVGALGIALLLGIAWRAAAGLPARAGAGATFAARTLLRIGVVLLGVRLDFGLLWRAGTHVLLLDLAIIAFGIVIVERVGARLGLERGLRLALAVGSSICGASAIAAAAPVVGAKDDDVSVSVGVVSLLGTVGVVGYTVLAPVLDMTVQRYGMMTGSTLQEVAQVLAAGAAQGPLALDIATITKLTRVALLAPVLLVIGGVLARHDARRAAGPRHVEPTHTDHRRRANPGARRPPLLPGFLVGFLLVGIVHSLGLIPVTLATLMQGASLLLTAAAMAGIGLGVDLRVVRRLGGPAIGVALIGFALSVAIATVGTMGLPK